MVNLTSIRIRHRLMTYKLYRETTTNLSACYSRQSFETLREKGILFFALGASSINENLHSPCTVFNFNSTIRLEIACFWLALQCALNRYTVWGKRLFFNWPNWCHIFGKPRRRPVLSSTCLCLSLSGRLVWGVLLHWWREQSSFVHCFFLYSDQRRLPTLFHAHTEYPSLDHFWKRLWILTRASVAQWVWWLLQPNRVALGGLTNW